MKQLTLSVVVVIGIAFTTSGQNRIYLGAEVSPFFAIQKIKDSHNRLGRPRPGYPQGGIVARFEIDSDFFIEAGGIITVYEECYMIGAWGGIYGSNFMIAGLAPVRFGASINLCNKKIFLVPVLGYALGILPNLPNDGPYPASSYGRKGFGMIELDGDVFHFSASADRRETRTYSLAQAGLAVELLILKRLRLAGGANYYKGFTEVYKITVEHTMNGADPGTGTVTSNGEFWNLSASLKYPIGNLSK